MFLIKLLNVSVKQYRIRMFPHPAFLFLIKYMEVKNALKDQYEIIWNLF